MRTLYLDTSALAKLVVKEHETTALDRYLNSEPTTIVTSVVGFVELRRVAVRAGIDTERVDAVLDSVGAVGLTPSIVTRAGSIPPASLRTLDAIHLASAQELQGDLAALVGYDRRLLDAAQQSGIRCSSPGIAGQTG